MKVKKIENIAENDNYKSFVSNTHQRGKSEREWNRDLKNYDTKLWNKIGKSEQRGVNGIVRNSQSSDAALTVSHYTDHSPNSLQSFNS